MNRRMQWGLSAGFLSIIFVAGMFSVNGQTGLSDTQKEEPDIVKNGTCAYQTLKVDLLTQWKLSDNENLIIISHLSKSEKKRNMGIRRLHNIKTYIVRRRMSELYNKNVITAEGERVDGTGYLDFYEKGNLVLRIHFQNGRDVRVGLCYSDPFEKPCEAGEDKLYYPCKKNKG